ncbi:MAG: succinate dehydrogenase, cytochrome b556 subunit [Pseudomonadota bacterium]
MSDKPAKSRPLSPHLQVYKPQISSVLSIMHRASGAYLFLGLLAMLWLAASISYYQETIKWFDCFAKCNLMKFIAFTWVMAFYYHLGNGIRHLWWDVGQGYEIKELHLTGKMVVAFALGLSVASFLYVF